MMHIKRLHEVLLCDPDKGILIWKPRPGIARNDRAGKIAGSKRKKDGYISLSIDRKPLLAHRIIWAMYYGYWPIKYLDHINRNRSDNRISNLREVSCSENCQNTTIYKSNKNGVKGVYYHSGGYEARISVNRKKIYLGFFRTFEEAKAARLSAEAVLHIK